jgi:hypothetical protein
VHFGLKTVIATRSDEIRARISSQRAQGKAIDHLSIPISTIANANPDFQQGVSLSRTSKGFSFNVYDNAP